MSLKMQLVLSLILVCFLGVNGQFYEDKRCRCICPSPAVVFNNSLSNSRKLFIANVPPNKCNCDEVILIRVSEEVRARQQEYCPRCECKYETRNTTVILEEEKKPDSLPEKTTTQAFCELTCPADDSMSKRLVVVVVIVVWLLMLLSVYMGFLLCLDPLIKRKRVRPYRVEGGREESCNLLIPGDDDD